MPRPRLPESVAKVKGADTKNPQRFSGRKPPKSSPVGKPPKHLSLAEIECWKEFLSELPWLEKADRAILETACQARAAVREDFNINAARELRLIVSQMGATPTTRTKVLGDEQDEPEDDEGFRFDA